MREIAIDSITPLWQSVAVNATLSQEVRARVEPIIKLAVEKQAEAERLAPPDIIRKAVWDYLIKQQSPFVTNVPARQSEPI